MRTKIIIVLLTFLLFACNSQDKVESGELQNVKKTTLIPSNEYIVVPQECSDKILSTDLIKQMSVKNYLFKHEKITNEELTQKVILYFEKEPDADQKTFLNNNSVISDWNSWTPPKPNHPYGFIIAELPITNFNDILCADFIKKIDNAEREISPDMLQKFESLKEE